jgi:NTP pyrophosphatase (non-canonical NTP hydrolase)
MNILEQHLREVVDRTWNYNKRCKTWDDHVWNAASGLSAEAGEVLDVHKKMFFHKERDRKEELMLELGDVLYYAPKLIELHGFTVEEVLAANKKKLFERYGIK